VKALRVAVLAFVAAFAGAASGASSQPHAAPSARVTVKLIAINDFHGYVLPSETIRIADPADPSKQIVEPVGGAAYLATAVAKLRAENPANVVVGAGDMVGASPLGSALFHDEGTIDALDAIGLRYTSVGNHEFDEGKAELLRKQRGGCRPGGTIGVDTCLGGTFRGAQYEYLAANVIDEATGAPLFPPYAIHRFDVGGRRVTIAFVGVVLHDTPKETTANGVRGVRFLDEADTVNALLPRLARQGIHAVVVLIHQGLFTQVGFDDHSCAGADGDLLPELDRLDPSIPLVISGHTHVAYICPHGEGTQRGRVFYTAAGRYGQMVTDLDVTLDVRHDTIVGIRAHNVLVVNDRAPNPAPSAYPAFAPDARVAAIVARYTAAAAPLVNREVGRITADFTTEGMEANAGGAGESAIGDLIVDARLAATSGGDEPAVAAFIDSGGVRSGLRYRSVDGTGTPGVVNAGDVYRVEPFGDLLLTETLTGAQLYELLAEQWLHKKNPEMLDVSRGVRYIWDASLPDGASKVVPGSLTIDGVPVSPTATYRITTDSFTADGGDGYVVLRDGTDRVTSVVDRDALAAYIAAHSPLTPLPLDRIIRKPEQAPAQKN